MSTPPEMWAHAPHHTACDVWALGMTLQACLLLADPLADCTMPELEERLCAKPRPRIPIYEHAEAAEGGGGAESAPPCPWPAALEPIASLARQCCCAEPGDRLKAEALAAALAPPARRRCAATNSGQRRSFHAGTASPTHRCFLLPF